MANNLRLPKVYAGRGCLDNMRHVLAECGAEKVAVLTDKGVVNAGLFALLRQELEIAGARWELWDEVEPEPSLRSLDRASSAIAQYKPDAVIALGGGSAIDTAKIACIAEAHGKNSERLLEPNGIRVQGRPIIAVPTTSGTGSEVTPVAVMTVPGRELKVGIVHPYLVPAYAVVDSRLTETAPARLTAAVGIDALSHALESYMARNRSVFAQPYNLEAIRRIRRSLRKAVADGSDREAREDLSIASLFAGIGLACTGVGAVHAIAYPLAAKHHIGHGESIALLLPESLGAMLPEAAGFLAEAAGPLGVDTQGLAVREAAEAAIEAVDRLIRDVGLCRQTRQFQADPGRFKEMAATAAGIDRLIRNSPRILRADEIERVYARTY